MTTPFDGVWASEPLTKQMMLSALDKAGIDASQFDQWFPYSDKIGYRTVEAYIGGGRWEDNEYEDGVGVGGWGATIAQPDESTIVATADDNSCTVTFKVARSGDSLSVDVAQDQCPGDLPLEVALYEASTMRLVQPAGWAPPPFNPPDPSGSLAPSQTTTSSTRQVAHPAGTVKGAPLGYLEYLPVSYSPSGEKSPLLVFLHGSGESGDGSELLLKSLASAAIPQLIAENRWPDDRPFVVLSPQHDDSQDAAYCFSPQEITDFLAFAQAKYNVDPARIYVTGLSCGAIGLWNYLGQGGARTVAAAVPIAGNGVGAFEEAGCSMGSVPIWAFHGGLDEPVHGDVYPVTQLQQCTNPPAVDARITVFPLSSHDVWTRTYELRDGYDIYSWMLSHSK